MSNTSLFSCLNPFDFRAGLLLLGATIAAMNAGLNPFDFRAGLLLLAAAKAAAAAVLIPLISGLVYYKKPFVYEANGQRS